MRPLIALLLFGAPLAAGAAEPCVAAPSAGVLDMGPAFAALCAGISGVVKMLRIAFPIFTERSHVTGRTSVRAKRLTMGAAVLLGVLAGVLGMVQGPQAGMDWQVATGILAATTALFAHKAMTSRGGADGKPGIGENSKRHRARMVGEFPGLER